MTKEHCKHCIETIHEMLKRERDANLKSIRDKFGLLKEKRRRYICSNGVLHSEEEVVEWRDVEEIFEEELKNER